MGNRGADTSALFRRPGILEVRVFLSAPNSSTACRFHECQGVVSLLPVPFLFLFRKLFRRALIAAKARCVMSWFLGRNTFQLGWPVALVIILIIMTRSIESNVEMQTLAESRKR